MINKKKLKKNKIEELVERGKHRDNYIDKVLAKCKSWGGPFLCIDDMKAVISGKSDDDQRKILRHEITFHKSTHPNDALIRKKLYLINQQDVPTMIYNLGISLSNDCTREENDKDVLLPTKEDVLSMLKSKTSDDQVNTTESQNFSDKNETIIASNELCAIIWDHRGELNWILGYLKKINENSIKTEHYNEL